MRTATLITMILAASLGMIPPAPASATNVNVNIVVPAPPPPPVVVATPRLVVIPGSPVLYAPGVSFNLFVHSGRYYSFHNGVWFHSPKRGGPWMVVAMDKVPHVVRAVPVTYYRIPPGHAKKFDKDGHPGKGPKSK
jgi:hypothetical protein